ncbi:hypothetical protein ACOMHN_055801 [Nucella lapillus]
MAGPLRGSAANKWSFPAPPASTVCRGGMVSTESDNVVTWNQNGETSVAKTSVHPHEEKGVAKTSVHPHEEKGVAKMSVAKMSEAEVS